MNGGMNDKAREWMVRLRNAFMNGVTEDDMRQLAQQLVKKAKDGDRAALQLLMTYLTPPQPAQEKPAPMKISAKEVRVSVREGKGAKVIDALPHRNGGGDS